MKASTVKLRATAIAVVVVAVPCLAQPPSRSVVPRTRSQAAWTHLAEGRDRDALRHFSRLTWLDPTAGRSRIGYALTVAGLGDLGRGARVMRLAVRINPEALDDLPIEAQLRARLDTLKSLYLTRLERDPSNRDAAFMLAALYYLSDENESARYARGLMTAIGDETPSAINLADLIESRSRRLPDKTTF